MACNVRLLIVDPIVSAISGDSHKNAEVRRSLQPLVDAASAANCALIGITHLSKGTRGREPIERLTGSLAFGALARLVYIVVKVDEDSENELDRLLIRAKSNIGLDGGGFEYEISETELVSNLHEIGSHPTFGCQQEKVGSPEVFHCAVQGGVGLFSSYARFVIKEAPEALNKGRGRFVEWPVTEQARIPHLWVTLPLIPPKLPR